MSGGGGAGGEREYRCACGGLLLVSTATTGRASAVYCRKCGTRQTVVFAPHSEPVPRRMVGRIKVLGDGDPHNPPIEDGPIRPWRR
jgi:hypothetical protein